MLHVFVSKIIGVIPLSIPSCCSVSHRQPFTACLSGICHALCSLQSFKGVSAMVLTYLGLSATIVIISNV